MARRSSGQIRPGRAPGTWRISVEGAPDPVSGRRRRIYRTVRGSRRDAERELARLTTQRDDGAVTAARGTVGELLDQWHATMTATRWRPATALRHRQDIDLRLRPALGDRQVARLTTAEVDAALVELVRAGRSPRTVRAAHQTLHAALQHAVRQGVVSRNVAKLATVPAQRRRRGAQLPTAAQLDAVLEHAAVDPFWHTWLAVAFRTGARPAELCALRWRHVDLEHATLTIEDAVERGEAGLAIGPTKTDRARTVALDLSTVGVLRRWRAVAAERALAMGAPLDPAWHVWPGDRVGPGLLAPDRASKAWRRYADAADIDPGVRLYDAARHRHISWALSMGFDIAVVAQRVGNSPETIARWYAHVMPGRDRAVADALDGSAAAPR